MQYPMSNRIFFERQITKPWLDASQILSALSDFSHLVYLKNAHQPVIAFLPAEYMIQHHSTAQSFKRSSCFAYEPQVDPLSFDGFFDDKNSSSAHAFNGGLIGFISYDYAAQQHLSNQAKPQPCLFLGIYRSYLKCTSQGWTFFSDEADAEVIFQSLQNAFAQEKSLSFTLTQNCLPRWKADKYQKAFQQVQEYIRAGDCYQINLTQEFQAKAEGLLLATAKAFWQLTDAPYSGYLKIDDFELLSCSPELFIAFESDRKIVTRPIKGTMPRYADTTLDQHSKQKLIDSDKDQAENLMIVDLLRNDLSVYAETGSVKTPQLFQIESFNQVHHMVSEVTATLKKEVNPLQVLISALPGGSITGAPKIRAMQIIDELEGAARGAYCGSLGYFNFDGTGCWNILIRSIQKYQNDVSLWAGGGITIASECDAEYQECFDKVAAMLDLLNTWPQVSTN